MGAPGPARKSDNGEARPGAPSAPIAADRGRISPTRLSSSVSEDHRVEWASSYEGDGVCDHRLRSWTRGRSASSRPNRRAIAMGLILEGERFAVLSDILGPTRDHLGDMEPSRVAGTSEGVTSLCKWTIKIAGITRRDHASGAGSRRATGPPGISWANKSQGAYRSQGPELGEFAPPRAIETMKIPTDKDPGGHRQRAARVIPKNRRKTGRQDQQSRTTGHGQDRRLATAPRSRAAVNWIKSDRLGPRKSAQIYDGTVVKTVEIRRPSVNFFGSKDGLVTFRRLGERPGSTRRPTSSRKATGVKVKVMGPRRSRQG